MKISAIELLPEVKEKIIEKLTVSAPLSALDEELIDVYKRQVEPCVMCAGAIAWAQTGKLVFGAEDPKRGYQKYAPDALSLIHI